MDVSIIPSNKINEDQKIVRPLTNYHPTVWGEFFIHSLAYENQIDHAQAQRRVEMLKEEVRIMFSTSSTADDGCHQVPLEEEMKVVDVLQRLGLAYHFEEEINLALARIHASHMVAVIEDLRVVSLRFRLLRRGGYNISAKEFNKFKDVYGNFRGNLCFDTEGLLSLYEASNYLGSQLEDGILDEAMSFCRRELESMLDRMEPPLAAEVFRALDMPLVRRIQRLEAREYLSFYEATEGRNDVILELAKLDFNRVQSLQQEEIRDLTRWWRELGLIEKLSFARDRLVECYLWMMGVVDEPHLSHVRVMMTKVICLASVLDDMYDSYGTLEELLLLTEVMQRWDLGEVEGLPEYIKTYFMALSDTIREFEQKTYPVHYLIEEFKALSKHYLKEAEWLDEGHMPTLQDHLQVSLTSSGARLLICGFFVCMQDVMIKSTQDIFDWLASNPKIVEASALITRLTGDVGSVEVEAKRRHVPSTVQCYMKDYGVSKEMAYKRLREMGDTAWKVLNEEWIRPTWIPMQLLAIPFGFSRMIELYYKRSDGYVVSNGKTKDLINLVLVERIPL